MRFSGILSIVAVTGLCVGVAAAAEEEAKPAPPDPPKALVLPFSSVGPEPREWIARAVMQNLMAELSRSRMVEPASGQAAADDQDAAIKIAQDAGARYVILGSYQVVENDLRITGQVLDVQSKQAIAGLKASGTLRDLFGLEDTIAAQVKRALPQPVEAAAPAMLDHPRPAAAAAAAGPIIMPRGPVQIGRAAQAADDLADAMDQAIERIRYRSTAYDDYYYHNRVYRHRYSGYGYPYYSYPIYYPGYIYAPITGGIVGKAHPSRDAGRTEHGIPRLSFPNFVPEQRRVKR